MDGHRRRKGRQGKLIGQVSDVQPGESQQPRGGGEGDVIGTDGFQMYGGNGKRD